MFAPMVNVSSIVQGIKGMREVKEVTEVKVVGGEEVVKTGEGGKREEVKDGQVEPPLIDGSVIAEHGESNGQV